MEFNYKFAKYLSDNAFLERFATTEEAKASLTEFDFNSNKHKKGGGIPLFSNGDIGHVDASDDHSLIIGTTGSMKTRALILPTIVSLGLAGENMVILDPKGEIYNRTSGFLHHEGYVVNSLNFRDLKHSDCWNPLHEPFNLIHNPAADADSINQGKQLINDFSAIIASMNEHNNSPQDPYWVNMAKEYIEGIVSLLVLGVDKESLCHVSNLSTFVNETLKEQSESITGEIIPTPFQKFIRRFPLSFSIRQKLAGILDIAQNTKTCIVSEAKSILAPFFSNKEIEFIVSQNTINLHDYADGKKKVVTYVIIPEEKPTYNFITTIFIKQLYAILVGDAEKSPGQSLKKRVNFILDEFANIPNIPDMDCMISAARSRNIRFFLVLQCNSQLRSKYGDDDATTIKNNCQNWVYLNSREKELIQEVQDLIGDDPSHDDPRMPARPAVSVNDLLGIRKKFPSVRSLVVRKDGKPFVTKLKDISEYPMITKKETNEKGELIKDDPIFHSLTKNTKKEYIEPLDFPYLDGLYSERDNIRNLTRLDDIENEMLKDELRKNQEPEELFDEVNEDEDETFF